MVSNAQKLLEFQALEAIRREQETTGMGVQSKNRAAGQSRDHKKPGWIYGAIGGADAFSQEMDSLCVSAALTWCLCVAVVVTVSMWLSSILRKVSSVDLAFLFQLFSIVIIGLVLHLNLSKTRDLPFWLQQGVLAYRLKGDGKRVQNRILASRSTKQGGRYPPDSGTNARYVGGLPDMIHGSVLASKRKIMQNAIEFATELMDKKISTLAERQIKNKRKQDENFRNNQNQEQQNKRQNTGRAYTARPSEKREYGGSLPKCSKCNYHHNGLYAPKCHKCKKVGYLARDCRSSGNANGHFKRECPKLKNKNRGNQGGNGNAPAKVYVVGNERTNPDSNVIIENHRTDFFPAPYPDVGISILPIIHNLNTKWTMSQDPDPITRISNLDVSDPLHLHPNDTTALSVVSIKLKGTKNYQDKVNAIVLGRILNSISEELFLGQIFFKRAKHVWEELKETYDKVDGSIMFGLHHKISTLKQNGSSIADYYHKLNALWKQYDAMIELPKCVCNDSESFKKHNKLLKLMQFHMGLDNSYMQIRSFILCREVLPDVRSAYATISSEKSHRVAAGSIAGSSQRNQASAFNLNSGSRPNNMNNNRQGGGSGLVCENCGFNGHTIDRCFKIIGYPAYFGKKKSNQSFKGKNISNNNSVGTSSSSGFIDEQMATMISLIKDNKIGKICRPIWQLTTLEMMLIAVPEDNMFSEGNLDQNPSSSHGVQNVRRSSRQSVFPRNYNDFIVESKVKYGLEKYVGYSKLNSEIFCFVTQLNKTREPKSYFEASKYLHLTDAMNQEMDALLRNNSWEIVDLPEGRKAIGRIDYEETFSPMVKMVTIKCLLNIVVSMSWLVFQLDVNIAFLYGDLEEVVYMKPPEGYFPFENKVCKLKMSLYGLKQALRKWNAKLTSTLIENGFSQSKSDYSLYTKSDKGVFLALLVYVDDIIITGNSIFEIEKFKVFLKSKFMIKDLRTLKYFLGIEVIDIDKGICLNQRKYILDLLSEYGLLACKPAKTPLMSKLGISNEACDNDPLLENVNDYQKLMGKLIYLTNTRPDISYVVYCLSQFMHSPLTSHLKIAFKIVRYFKSCPGLGIHIAKTSGMFLNAYSAADWAKCVVTRKSVTGYCVFLNNSLVSWKSKKQNTLSKSLTEVEYKALASVTSEVIWILNFLKDLQIENLLPVSLYCDNNSAIKIDANPVFHERTKHLEIYLHFVREKVLEGVVKTVKLDSANQIADILTKGWIQFRLVDVDVSSTVDVSSIADTSSTAVAYSTADASSIADASSKPTSS
ncbi:ribonuclease H-like domain-containing protein [Tanacetum coccineum]